MHDGIIFAKLGIALICAVFCALLVRSSRVAALPDRRFDQFILLLWGVTRLGLFCAVFVIAGMQVTSDASGVYYPQGLAALAGKTVYRDFKSS